MLYSHIVKSKNNLEIPIFKSGKPMHSMYNPKKEAMQFAKDIPFSGFFVISGLGGAYHIDAVLNKYPESNILIIENSYNDIDFLKKNIPFIQNIILKDNIFICTIEEIEQKLLEHYTPSLSGSFSFIEQKSWMSENNNSISIKIKIKEVLKIISADFSVQAHFGKIWQKNIHMNLKNSNKTFKINFPLHKTALIAAAGPSLENKIEWIKKNRNNIYLIASDTAYSIFCKQNILCDAVLSIDGQMISYMHFIEQNTPSTLFIFDPAGNTSAVRKLKKDGCKTILIGSSHPLSYYAQASQKEKNTCINVEIGLGTVTIAAADFALKTGFQNILIAGADFSYTGGKPYSKGTYLDKIYNLEQNKLNTIEHNFCKLMFRTNLIGNSCETLIYYKKNLEKWIQKNNLNFIYENDFYVLSSKKQEMKNENEMVFNLFDFDSYKNQLKTDLIQIEKLQKNSLLLNACLPYISYLRKRLEDEKTADFRFFLKLALSNILRYTN